MSEGNERKIEGAAPEAAKDIQPTEAATDKASAKKEKKAKHGGTIVLLVVVLLLLAAALVLGYGLGRNRKLSPVAEEPTAEVEVEESAPAYDAFTEELTKDNQKALDALSGANTPADEASIALLGEDEKLTGAVMTAEPSAEPVIVAEYGDGQQLTSDEVLQEYSEQLSIYILAGYSEEEVAETLLDSVLNEMVRERVIAGHAQELGLYELSDADHAEIEAEAQKSYESYLDDYRELINGDGMTEEEIEGAAKAYLMDAEGINYDYLVDELEKDWWHRKLFDEITASVRVDDATVQEAYDALAAEQKQSFAEMPDEFTFARLNGEIIVYNPPGYRNIKLLQLGFEDAETAATAYALMEELAELERDSEEWQQKQEELNACYAPIEARAQELLGKLRAGADMETLMESEGGSLRVEEYCVSSNSEFWSEDFTRAAMALEATGDYSEPVRTEEGVCILQYLGDVSEGEVPMADVREALEAQALTNAQNEAYEAQIQSWMEAANPSFYPERMQ